MRRKVAEYRQRKKGLSVETTNIVASNALPSIPEEGYKTKSALDKAVAKMKRAAPSTTVKQKQAVCKYLKSFKPNDLEEIVQTIEGKTIKAKSTRAISSTVIESVKAFYLRDDISRMSPNMRDCRKFVDPTTGLSEVKPLRYLMYKLEDVYHMFVKYVQNGKWKNDLYLQRSYEQRYFELFSVLSLCEFQFITGDATIKPPLKSTKFYQLRPENVRLVNSTPLDTCFCYYHTNFIMCCKAIKRYLPQFPKYGKKLEQVILCEPPQKACWWRNCSSCSNKIQTTMDNIVKHSKIKLEIRVEWTQWTKSTETNRFQKHVASGTLGDLQKRFLDILPDFLKHSCIKRCQASTFESDTEEVRQSNWNVAIVQIDFAEGYTCQAQDEIQSAHFNQASVWYLNFFICVLCFKDKTIHVRRIWTLMSVILK